MRLRARNAVRVAPWPAVPQNVANPVSPYARVIERLAPAEDPAHVEAWMRLAHGPLDSIDAISFAAAVKEAAARVRTEGSEESESLARHYDLRPTHAPAKSDSETSHSGSENRQPGAQSRPRNEDSEPPTR